MARARAAAYKPAIRSAAGVALSARIRKLFGLVAMMAFLAAYIWLAMAIADRLPQHWAAQLAFYVVAGLGWGVPILPLISWMNRGR